MKILWRNFPIPEPFIASLLAGCTLQVIIPASILPHSDAWWVVGLVLIFLGAALTIWTVITAGNSDLERPASLVTGGPYAISRNPMYLAWGIFSAGLSLVFNSLWLASAALIALLYLHFATIPKEEQVLQRNFGAAYEVYRKHVRRWL